MSDRNSTKEGEATSEMPTVAPVPIDREQVIVRASLVGIATNVLLVAAKATIGLAAGSIAIVLDAVNNLTDVMSSVVTIVGARLAAKEPDRDHPMGHGRIEYLSSLVVGAIILYAGITALIESVGKVITPEVPNHGPLSIAIVALSVAVKVALGLYVRGKGKEVGSGALSASGSDALFDAVMSASVLASILFHMATGILVEAYVGIAISAVIIRAGFGMMRDTVDDIIGHREDAAMTRRVRELLREEPEVHGAYDLVLFDYGPERHYGSVHLELDDVMTVDDVDRLTRRVEKRIFRETGIILTGVSVYARNTKGDVAAQMRDDIREMAMAHEGVLQMHGFHVDEEEREIRFDVVVSFDVDRVATVDAIRAEVAEAYPGYDIHIVMDVNFSD